jgi:hypothetical protein
MAIEEMAGRIAASAIEARPRFVINGKPKDENRQALGCELSAIWWEITQRIPAGSNSGNVDSPGTEFGRFVKRALGLTPDTKSLLDGNFNGFVLDAAGAYRTALPPVS